MLNEDKPKRSLEEALQRINERHTGALKALKDKEDKMFTLNCSYSFLTSKRPKKSGSFELSLSARELQDIRNKEILCDLVVPIIWVRHPP